MKFNKLILGLAAFPLLLTSCNSAMSRDQVSNWIKSHYKAGTDFAAVSSKWNYTGVKGSRSVKILSDIIKKDLAVEIEKGGEGLKGFIETNITGKPSGRMNYIGKSIEVAALDATAFASVKFSTDPDNDVFKVNGNSLNVTYKRQYLYDQPKKDDPKTWKYVTTTSVRVFNGKGYCTDYGCKVDGKWIDKNNNLKFKITLHFTYATDPVD